MAEVARERGRALVRGGAAWIDRQGQAARGAFRFSPESAPSLIGTSCAVLAAELFGVLDGWSETRKRDIAKGLLSHRGPDGWFVDPMLRPNSNATLNGRYLAGHATFLASMALDALRDEDATRFDFIDDGWRDDDALYAWLDQLDWTQPWRESNWVEWIGYSLLADAGVSVADVPLARTAWPAGFAGLMAWLVDHQDRATGMWGAPALPEPFRTLHQMAAAYHHYVFYYGTGTTIPLMDVIVDRTLALQQPDGLFLPAVRGGGPCEDLDAIDILANMHRLADYRRADIEQALRRALTALLRNQRQDGGFVNRSPLRTRRELLGEAFTLNVKPGLRRRLGAIKRTIHQDGQGDRTAYAGCQSMPFYWGGGDMFSQWFRPLSVALAASVLGEDEAPVWWDFGFRDRITQSWWPGAPVMKAAAR